MYESEFDLNKLTFSGLRRFMCTTCPIPNSLLFMGKLNAQFSTGWGVGYIIGNFLLAANRFTAVRFPFRHDKVLILLLSLFYKILVNWMVIFQKVIFRSGQRRDWLFVFLFIHYLVKLYACLCIPPASV